MKTYVEQVLSDGTTFRRFPAGGKLHCPDKPAAVYADGTEEWWFHGTRHRADGPAKLDASRTTKIWWVTGFVVDVQDEDEGNLTYFRRCYYNIPETEGEFHDLFLVDTPDMLGAVLYVKENANDGFLRHWHPKVAAIAAWHLPVDENYVTVALDSAHVRNIMQYRQDVPEHMQALMDVAA